MDDPSVANLQTAIPDDDPAQNALGGNFHNVLITHIIVGERFRKDYGDIEALKRSITAFGLLEPVVLDRDNNLLAGGRRLRAVTELGRPRIPAQYIDEVTPIRAREIELEENLQRLNLGWLEEANLIKEINELKQKIYADTPRPPKDADPDAPRGAYQTFGWTQDDTADFIGQSPSQVSRKIAIATAVEIMPELANEENTSQALKKLDRRIEELEREIEFRRNKRLGAVLARGQVLHGCAESLLATVQDKSVDCVIIDPPYGVLEMGGIGRYEAGVHFDDDPTKAMATLRAVATQLKRVMKDDAHMYVFFGIKMFTETKEIFTSLGFDVDPIPLVWVKTTGSVVDWDYRFSNFYEPILFISNRTRRLASGKHSNVLMYSSVPSQDRSNIAEKPRDLIKRLIELSTKELDLVLDCFAGSGVTALAATELKRRYIVIEKDEQQWKEITNRLSALASSLSADPTQQSTVQESSATLTPHDDSQFGL